MDALQNRLIPDIQIIDLDRVKPSNVSNYHPKMLMMMCLGYLKLAMIDPKVKDFFI